MRTRAATGGAVGAWSNTVTFPVGSAPCTSAPDAPILLPVTSTPGQVTFTWLKTTGGTPDRYQVQIAPGAGLAPITTLSSTDPGTSLVWSQTAGTFAARVVGLNGCGTSPRSNELAFTIG